MKRLLLCVVLLFLVASPSHGQVCQERLTTDTDVWADPPTAGETFGHVTWAPVGFDFEIYAVANEANLVYFTAETLVYWGDTLGLTPNIKYVYAEAVGTGTGVWIPWKEDGVTFEGYYNNTSDSAVGAGTWYHSQSFGSRTSAPLSIEMQGHNKWNAVAVNTRYPGYRILTRMTLMLKVC